VAVCSCKHGTEFSGSVKDGNFSTSWATVSFSRRILLHVVICVLSSGSESHVSQFWFAGALMTGCGLDRRVLGPGGAREWFFLLPSPPPGLSLGVKRPGRETDRSPVYGAEVKNAWSYASSPQYVFMGRCLVKHSVHLHGVILG